MPKRILALDDEPEILEVISEILSEKKYDVVTAETREEAFQRIQEKMPDLILLDILMPGPNGLQVLESLKANPKTRHVPVVMLSAAGGTENIFEAKSLMASDFFIKPFTADELLRIVSKYL